MATFTVKHHGLGSNPTPASAPGAAPCPFHPVPEYKLLLIVKA